MFIEITGSAFSNPYLSEVDAICITTNMSTKRNGKAVMGAGIAKDAKSLFNGIDEDLGALIRDKGSVVFPIRNEIFHMTQRRHLDAVPVQGGEYRLAFSGFEGFSVDFNGYVHNRFL